MNVSAPLAARVLHIMLRVRDPARMIEFYCGLLGMCELRRIEFREQRYTLIFLGYAEQPHGAQLELWHEWDRSDPYAPGEAYGHIGIGVKDIVSACAQLRAAGVPIRREPGAMRPGGRVIALVEDPEGHEVELLADD